MSVSKIFSNFDRHGQLHSGSIGLFDCALEEDKTQRELRERQERREKRTLKHDRRRAKQEAAGSILPTRLQWVTRKFGIGKAQAKEEHAVLEEDKEKDDGPSGPRRRDANTKRDSCSSSSTLVDPADEVHQTFPASDIHPESSPFLEELSMVRVKSDNPEDCGWKIVSQACIREE